MFARLKEHGLLLRTDAKLPNLCSLVAGETVHGSWWAHPRGRDIFAVDSEMEHHPDVLMAKLVSGKVTFVHRDLWPPVVDVGRAREPWQMRNLWPEGRKLLGPGRSRTDRAKPGREQGRSRAGNKAFDIQRAIPLGIGGACASSRILGSLVKPDRRSWWTNPSGTRPTAAGRRCVVAQSQVQWKRPSALAEKTRRQIEHMVLRPGAERARWPFYTRPASTPCAS